MGACVKATSHRLIPVLEIVAVHALISSCFCVLYQKRQDMH